MDARIRQLLLEYEQLKGSEPLVPRFNAARTILEAICKYALRSKPEVKLPKPGAPLKDLTETMRKEGIWERGATREVEVAAGIAWIWGNYWSHDDSDDARPLDPARLVDALDYAVEVLANWHASQSGPETLPFQSMPLGGPWAAFAADDGPIVVCGEGDTLIRREFGSGRALGAPAILGATIRSVVTDRLGSAVWALTDRGLTGHAPSNLTRVLYTPAVPGLRSLLACRTRGKEWFAIGTSEDGGTTVLRIESLGRVHQSGPERPIRDAADLDDEFVRIGADGAPDRLPPCLISALNDSVPGGFTGIDVVTVPRQGESDGRLLGQLVAVGLGNGGTRVIDPRVAENPIPTVIATPGDAGRLQLTRGITGGLPRHLIVQCGDELRCYSLDPSSALV